MRYRYELETNVPVAAVVGMGNTPSVSVYSYARGEVGETTEARSNGAATADGHHFKLRLMSVDEEAQA